MFTKRSGYAIILTFAISSAAVAGSVVNDGSTTSLHARNTKPRATPNLRLTMGPLDIIHNAARWGPILGVSDRYAEIFQPFGSALVSSQSFSLNMLMTSSEQSPAMASTAAPGAQQPSERFSRPMLSGTPGPVPSVGPSGSPQAPRLPGASVPVPEPSMLAQPPNVGYQPVPTSTPISMALHRPYLALRPTSRLHDRRGLGPNVVNSSALSITGMNHWWSYEEDSIPGVGTYMINVGTGNLVVQASDMSVPNKGVDLAFLRTYNSQSTHDYVNTDGSVPSNFGDDWTNTFDAHMATNSAGNLSVFDVDGARYDYGGGYINGGTQCFTPPAGQFATLCWDGANGYYWTKKDGSEYYFHSPTETTSPVLAGRIHEIFGRHHHNFLLFNYTTDQGEPATYQYLNTITVTTEDGRVATLNFGIVQYTAGVARELANIVYPDGSTTVSYLYTVNGANNTIGVTEVDEPGNGSITGWQNNAIPQQYTYTNGRMDKVSSPRWATSLGPAPAPLASPTDGVQLEFYFNSTSSSIAKVTYTGNMDPSIPSVSNGAPSSVPAQQVQSGYSAQPFLYRTVTVAYQSASSESCVSSTATAATDWSDTDGHHTAYCTDASQRVVESHHYTGDSAPGPSYITLQENWDSLNDAVSAIDASGNKTDYAYDNNGNLLAAAGPAVGGIRATSLYQYDANNNVVAYCDPVWSNANNDDWAPPAPPNQCSIGSGVTVLQWSPPVAGADPFGELTKITTPLGYNEKLAYSPLSQQGGNDYGLPVSVTGDSFTQDNNVVNSPVQSFTYDSAGDLVCYSKGGGTWALQYDALNRPIEIADPDDGSSLSVTQCTKQSNSKVIVSYSQYFANGAVQYDETPLQRALDISQSKANFTNAHAFTYDSDGDQLTESTQFGNQSGLKLQFYDAADREVEVVLQYDPRIFAGPFDYGATGNYDSYVVPWATRYLYDLTKGGVVALSGGSSFAAHGNLFSTQEYLPSTGSYAFLDTKGNAYDALDRPTSKYSYIGSSSCNGDCSQPYAFSSITYDTDTNGSTLGLPRLQCNSLGWCKEFGYDAEGRMTGTTYSGDKGVTANATMTYTLNGQLASDTSTGIGTESYVYDNDHRLSEKIEASGDGVSGASNLTYGYYGNGTRESVSVSPQIAPGFVASHILDYSYGADGSLDEEDVAFPYNGLNQAYKFVWTYTSAGRLLTRVEGTPSAPTSVGSIAETYDTSGLLLTSTIPAGAYSSFVRDPEGEIVSYNVTGTASGGAALVRTISARGEILENSPHARDQAADGLLLGQSYVCPPNLCPGRQRNLAWVPSNVQYGTRSDAMITELISPKDCENDVCTGGAIGEYQYDTNGRQTTASASWGLESGAYTRSYDADDHLISQVDGTWPTGWLAATTNGDNGYVWGPNGHPSKIGYVLGSGTYPNVTYGSLTYDTLHWDGDSLLFETDSNDNVDGIFIGKLAAITQPGTGPFTVFDRDPDGSVVSEHNSSTTYGALNADNMLQRFGVDQYVSQSAGFVPGATSLALIGNVGSGVGLGTVADPMLPDGVTDGTNTFQGGRTFDSSIGSWIQPDADSGEVGDPMSQRSYVWNRNNPVAFSDPSGFAANKGQGYDPVAAFLAGNWDVAFDDHVEAASVYWKIRQLLGVAIAEVSSWQVTYPTSTEVFLQDVSKYLNQEINSMTDSLAGKLITEYLSHVESQGGRPTLVDNLGAGLLKVYKNVGVFIDSEGNKHSDTYEALVRNPTHIGGARQLMPDDRVYMWWNDQEYFSTRPSNGLWCFICGQDSGPKNT